MRRRARQIDPHQMMEDEREHHEKWQENLEDANEQEVLILNGEFLRQILTKSLETFNEAVEKGPKY